MEPLFSSFGGFSACSTDKEPVLEGNWEGDLSGGSRPVGSNQPHVKRASGCWSKAGVKRKQCRPARETFPLFLLSKHRSILSNYRHPQQEGQEILTNLPHSVQLTAHWYPPPHLLTTSEGSRLVTVMVTGHDQRQKSEKKHLLVGGEKDAVRFQSRRLGSRTS